MLAIHHLLDLQYVKRWNIVGTTMDDNVQSHSFRVAVIAMAICEKLESDLTGCDRTTFMHEVLQYSLFHDAEEAFTGDIATTVKDEMKKRGFEPAELFPNGMKSTTLDGVPVLVKAADLIDNYHFISCHGVGDRAIEAKRYVRKRLEDHLSNICDKKLEMAAREVLFDIIIRQNDGSDEKRSDFTEIYPDIIP